MFVDKVMPGSSSIGSLSLQLPLVHYLNVVIVKLSCCWLTYMHKKCDLHEKGLISLLSIITVCPPGIECAS